MNRRKNVIIGILLLAIGAMTIGYAALARQLNIDGTANINASWEIVFTGINEGTMNGATTVGTPSVNGTSATFEVDLEYPGATATYDIVVENRGTIDAVLESITGLNTANESEPVQIQYSVTGISPNDDLLSGSTRTLTVTVAWVESNDPENPDVIPDVTQKIATIHLNYVQNTG